MVCRTTAKGEYCPKVAAYKRVASWQRLARDRVREDNERAKTTIRDHMQEGRGEVEIATRGHVRRDCEKERPCERIEGRETGRRSNSAP